jgi:hypothetical protein
MELCKDYVALLPFHQTADNSRLSHSEVQEAMQEVRADLERMSTLLSPCSQQQRPHLPLHRQQPQQPQRLARQTQQQMVAPFSVATSRPVEHMREFQVRYGEHLDSTQQRQVQRGARTRARKEVHFAAQQSVSPAPEKLRAHMLACSLPSQQREPETSGSSGSVGADESDAGIASIVLDDAQESFQHCNRRMHLALEQLQSAHIEAQLLHKQQAQASETSLQTQSMSEMRAFVQRSAQRLLGLQHAELQAYALHQRMRRSASSNTSEEGVEALHELVRVVAERALNALLEGAQRISLFRDTYQQLQKHNLQLIMTFENRWLRLQARSAESRQETRRLRERVQVSMCIQCITQHCAAVADLSPGDAMLCDVM